MAGRQPSPVVPARRVDEHGVEPAKRQLPHVRTYNGDTHARCVDRNVVQRELQAGQVGIDADDDAVATRPRAPAGWKAGPASQRGQRGQVPPDAAAQVSDQARAGEPGSRMPCSQLRGGLLEACPGEQHPVGPAELRPSRRPQRLLGQRGRDQLGWILLAQGRGQGQHPILADVLHGEPVEQLPAGR